MACSGALDGLLDGDVRLPGHGLEQAHLVRRKGEAQRRVVRAVLHVEIDLHLGELGVQNGGGMHERLHRERGVPLFHLLHLLGVVVVHLRHAHAGVHEGVGDADDLVPPQGHAGQLPALPQGDVAKLKVLGKRHPRADFLGEAVLRDSPLLGDGLQVAVDGVAWHSVLLSWNGAA